MRCSILLGLLACSPTASSQDSQPIAAGTDVDKSVPPAHVEAVRKAQTLGYLLQQQDRAVWVSTDTLVEKGIAASHPEGTGWLASQQDAEGNQWVVAYTEGSGSEQVSFVDALVTLSTDPPTVQLHLNEPGRELNDYDRFLVQYRDMVLKSDKWLRCAQNYNHSVGIEIVDGKRQFVVKLLPGRTDVNIFPLGGFHEFRFFPFEKDRKSEHFSQTKSCLAIDTSKSNPVAFVVSHLTSPTPTQFHVFMSLSYDKPIYVTTVENELMWQVEAGRISIMKADPGAAANE
ncbi:hypothetical protein [Arenimonas sp.]|uniref:hypothetical protein n=1 Tax=Arenimonas sp. TaxID=1872635 RepID=UPI0039E3BD17